MNTSQRGMTLIEVMAALVVFTIAGLGLTAGVVVAVNTNALSAKRTLAAQFAQSRVERLLSETRTKIPTSASPCCAAMAAGGVFNPDVPPGTGGWMIDVIDGAAPAGAAGNDAMFGPVLVADASASGKEDPAAKTVALRAQTYAAWTSATLPGGCAHASLQAPGVLCREVHIEPLNTGGVPMLRAWVRVLQGGVDWRAGSVVMQEDIAQ